MKAYRAAQRPPSSRWTILDRFGTWHPLLRFYLAAFTVLIIGSLLGYSTQFGTELWLSIVSVLAGLTAFYLARPMPTDISADSTWGFLRETLRFNRDEEADLSGQLSRPEQTAGKLVLDREQEDFGFRYAVRHTGMRYYAIIHLEGNLDSDVMSHLCRPLFEVTNHYWGFMIVDLDHVRFMNDRGMEDLLYCHTTAPEFGVSVRFVSEHPQNLSALEKVRRTGVPIYGSISAALTAAAEDSI